MSQAVVAPPSEPARQANLNEHTHIGILDQALCLILIFVKKSYAKIMPKGAYIRDICLYATSVRKWFEMGLSIKCPNLHCHWMKLCRK